MATTKKISKKVVKKSESKAKRAVAVVEKTVKKELAQKPVRPTGLSISVLGIDGKSKGTMTLPKELFGVTVNQQLLAQSIRVHRANLRVGHASTKTRGEVEGSTRKIYKQKGTGKARHGGIRAPVFVGGGIAFGPRPQDHSLVMPKQMQKAALASALTYLFQEGKIICVDGLSDIPPKTKEMAKALSALGVSGRALLVMPDQAVNVHRSSKNIALLDGVSARSVFPYALVSHPRIIMMKESIKVLEDTFMKEKAKKIIVAEVKK